MIKSYHTDLNYLLMVTALLLLINGCTAPVLKQFFPGTFYTEDSIYQSKSIRFLITYSGGWYLFTDPKEMDPQTRNFYESLHKSHMELLYAGATTDGLYGTRCIAAQYNLPIKEFAENIRNTNKNSVQNDSGLIDFLAVRNPCVKWSYEQYGFRFVEYFFKIDAYDVRIAFWTKPDLFDNYKSVFELIISTLTLTNTSL